jgi:hypothetical protein
MFRGEKYLLGNSVIMMMDYYSGREADHSPPASAEVNKLWTYTSTPPYAFMAQCLVC